MSILASIEQLQVDWGFLAWLLVAIVLAVKLRVFHPRSIKSPDRMGHDEPLGPLLVVFVIAGLTWFAAQVAFVSFRCQQLGHVLDTQNLSPSDGAFISTVPGLLGMAFLFIGDRFSGRGLLDRLGLTTGFFRGLAQGLLGIIMVWPVVISVMFASELLYQHWHFEHPHEHDLLRSLGGAHEMAMRVLLIFGACVVAPIFEEYAFRAHLQTFLRQFFIARRLSPSTGVPVEGEGVSRATFANEPPVGPDSPSLGMLAAGNSGGLNPRMQIPDSRLPTPDPRPPAPRLWQSWLAIVFASLLFAMIHPGWMRPGIFVLSLGLGYIYERTGNLWAAITMHALFNSISTIVYLNVG